MDEYAELSPIHRAMVQARVAHSDTTGIIDNDPHFIIDAASRKIVNNGGKNTLVQYDHNSERITFELPRYIEGHDMSNCNKVAINYLDATATGLYEVDDLAVKNADTETVAFTWLISSNVTQIVGKLAFAIEFECVQTDGEITYSWHTGVNEDIRIISTIVNDTGVVYDNVDILEQWKQQLFSTSEKAMEFIQNTFFDSAAAHNAIYRGKKLGNALTSEMLASIRDGSFSDLYVGDYIETEDNIYRFMDFDYFLGCVSGVSGGKIEKHHAVLVPDRVMGSSAIDNHPDTTQPKETHMYVNKLQEITRTLKNIFGNDNVATMDRIIPKTTNGEPTNWDRVNVGADLLTEEMVMGHGSWGQWPGIQIGVLKGQLAGFRYSHFLMCSNDDYWLRNKRSVTNYALISSDGISSSDIGNLQHGVRPFFVIW
jgi:hypothetical protein|nr:MAG TPA: hypothetical protein [Caudoviricetes sp.]